MDGETAEQAYNDLGKLRVTAHKQWVTENRNVMKYEAELQTAENDYNSASYYHDWSFRKYMDHTGGCYYCNGSSMCSDGNDLYDSWQTYAKERDKAKKKVKSIKSSLSSAKRAKIKQEDIMEKCDSARLDLGIEIHDYLEEKAEKKAEVKKIVEEVLNESPGVISELKKLVEDQSDRIKRLEDAVRSLQERSD